MPMKKWFRQMQPVPLYVVLVVTIMFFLTELVVSHITHALTLLMNSYHMLCNIIALLGCLFTIKYGKNSLDNNDCDLQKTQSVASSIGGGEELTTTKLEETCHDKKDQKSSASNSKQEKSLKNTFGWARIDVISMLICFVFMASLCFSIVVEAFQTLAHIDHQDEMHHPLAVLCLGAGGLLVNGICYLLVGGYTFHQGSFLYVTEAGNVVLNKVVVGDSVSKGQRRLSRSKRAGLPTPPRERQGFLELFRDVYGCILIIICALIVIFVADKNVGKFVDPILSIVSAIAILVLSYPYMKESCLILLQTIPGSIDINSLKVELLQHFPDIVNVHDFHVWQLTASKVVSTVHIIFQNPKVYYKIMSEINEFFVEYGITQVTVQPEFFTNKTDSVESLASSEKLCLIECQEKQCKEQHCCPTYEEDDPNKIIKSRSKEELSDKNKKNETRLKEAHSVPVALNISANSWNRLNQIVEHSKSEMNLTTQPTLETATK